MNTESFEKEFSALVDATGPYETSPHICVAVSGGSDSMALVLLLESWRRARGGRLTAVSIDHQLRPSSQAEIDLVGSWLSERGIEHCCLKWENPVPDRAVQENARLARYRLLEKWCADNSVLHLFTAHTAEDQAETFLMRLNKGSGSDGLSGMSVIKELSSCRLIRPLLSVHRADLRAYLKAHDQDWIEDPSNEDTRFERVRWRKLVSENNVSVERLCTSAASYGRARLLYDREVAKLAASSVTVYPAGYIQVHRDALTTISHEVALRLFAWLVKSVGGRFYPPRQSKLEYLLTQVRNRTRDSKSLGGCNVRWTQDIVMIFRENRNLPAPMHVKNSRQFIWDGRFQVSIFISGETDPDGIRLCALGEKLKRHIDLAYLAKLPEGAVAGLPALIDDTGFLSVPHLKFTRMSEAASRTHFSDIRFRSLNSASGSGYFVAN